MGSDAIRVETDALSQAVQAAVRSANRFVNAPGEVDHVVPELTADQILATVPET